jgi:hypothetical protein
MYLFLFHAGILIFGIASIHMTIGFNFWYCKGKGSIFTQK